MPRRRRESDEMAAFLRRLVRAMVRRAAGGDLGALTALAEVAGVVDAALNEAGRALHDAHGYSYAALGAEMGMSRQAALKRLGGPVDGLAGPVAGGGAGDQAQQQERRGHVQAAAGISSGA